MIELLALVFVIVIVVVAVRLGRQDDAPAFTDRTTAPTSNRSGCLSEGLAFARQHAEQTGDTEAVQAIDNGIYKELLEHRATAHESKIAPGIEIYQYSIAGINYREGIAAYVGKFDGYLQQDTKNEYDPNAIAVYADDGHHLGYIPATDTYEVHSLRLRFPIPVSVDIEECYDYDESRRFFVGSVTVLVKNKTSVTNRSKSSVTNDQQKSVTNR
jgi:hypothetical protein